MNATARSPVQTLGVAHPERTPSWRLFLFAALIFLTVQGLPNALLSGTPLVAWKQVLLMICFFLSIITVRGATDTVISSYVIIVTIFLCIIGLDSNVDLYTSFANSYYYIAWLPFYLLGTGTANGVLVRGATRLAFALVLVSAVGLMLQLYSNLLDFLKIAAEASYRAAFQETQRFAFVFLTSTGVMPTLFGLTRVYLGYRNTTAGRAWVAVALMASAVPTGSLAGFITLGGSLFALIAGARKHVRVILLTVVIATVVGALWFGGDLIDRQIDRILSNDASSVSNRGRVALWLTAVDLIQGFRIDEHLFGMGLGVTNSNYFGLSAVIHGESTFFQGYIEGGIFGLSLRLLPFVIYAQAVIRFRTGLHDFVYLLTMATVCAVAPIFGIFGVQCLLGFNAGLAVAHGRAKWSTI